MYNATSQKTIEECVERVIDLLQLIAPAREIRGEDKVRQLADTRRKPIFYIMLEVFLVHQSLNEQNAPKLELR